MLKRSILNCSQNNGIHASACVHAIIGPSSPPSGKSPRLLACSVFLSFIAFLRYIPESEPLMVFIFEVHFCRITIKRTTSLSRERDRFAPLWSKFQTLANNTVLCSAHHGPSPSIPNWVCIPKCGCQVPRVPKSRLGNGFFGFCNLNVLFFLSADRFLNKTSTLALAWLQI